jgi:hypothetical protein
MTADTANDIRLGKEMPAQRAGWRAEGVPSSASTGMPTRTNDRPGCRSAHPVRPGWGDQVQTFAKISVPLVPPKPKEFFTA